MLQALSCDAGVKALLSGIVSSLDFQITETSFYDHKIIDQYISDIKSMYRSMIIREEIPVYICPEITDNMIKESLIRQYINFMEK